MICRREILKCMAQHSSSSPPGWWLSKSWQPQPQPQPHRSNKKESKVHSGMPWRDLFSDKTLISENYENEIGKFRSPGRGSVFSSTASDEANEWTLMLHWKIENNFYVLFLINFSSPGSWDEKKNRLKWIVYPHDWNGIPSSICTPQRYGILAAEPEFR